MNIPETLIEYGFTRIECGRIMQLCDQANYRKAIRNAKHRINQGGVYAITAVCENGNVIPFYIGSSKNIRARLSTNNVEYVALSQGYTNIKAYFKIDKEYTFTESFMIETLRPVFNCNQPWRPKDFTITI